MRRMSRTADLPLRYRTPDAWARAALADPLALLNDHAHLEKKAAANALELLNRWPEPEPPEYWVEKMTAIARDEVDHLATVTRMLARRGGQLTKFHRNPYANELRSLVRTGRNPDELIDRLMVSALIEARSCERFEVLARCCEDADLVDASGTGHAPSRALTAGRSDEAALHSAGACADRGPATGRGDAELKRLYEDLWGSENGHYRIFIELARAVPGAAAETIEQRWSEWLDTEARIIATQSPGPRMHAGV